jgi:hypothetical protein
MAVFYRVKNEFYVTYIVNEVLHGLFHFSIPRQHTSHPSKRSRSTMPCHHIFMCSTSPLQRHARLRLNAGLNTQDDEGMVFHM